MPEDTTKLMWWGYLHSNGTIHVKRWHGDHKDYTDDCKNNPFVVLAVPPVEAQTQEEAAKLVKKAIWESEKCQSWIEEKVKAATASWAEKGKAVERGWNGLVHMIRIENAPEHQKNDMRLAFYSGAMFLLEAIASIVSSTGEDDEEKIKKECGLLTNINKELQDFREKILFPTVIARSEAVKKEEAK